MNSEDTQNTTPKPKKTSFLQIFLAIFWGFFGVRKNKEWQNDADSITPAQVIIGGIIGGIVFVAILILIVRMVVS